jgi:hypothetical protein
MLRARCALISPVGQGVWAVYRVSFVLCVYFVLMAALTSCTTALSASLHRGFWFAKILLLLALLAWSVYLDNETFAAYREVARYASLPFLLAQTIYLISFGYDWNGAWVDWDGEEYEGLCGWKGGLLLCSALLYSASATLWVLCWGWFTGDGCSAQAALIVATVAAAIAVTVLAFTEKYVPHGAIITSAVVTAYCTYLCYEALASHPDGACNPLAASAAHPSHVALQVGAGCVLLVVALKAAASPHGDAEVGKEDSRRVYAAVVGASAHDGHERLQDADDSKVAPEAFWTFNLTMALCACYLSMLLTAWSTEAARSGDGVGVGLPNLWVKLASEWACFLLCARALIERALCLSILLLWLLTRSSQVRLDAARAIHAARVA